MWEFPKMIHGAQLFYTWCIFAVWLPVIHFVEKVVWVANPSFTAFPNWRRLEGLRTANGCHLLNPCALGLWWGLSKDWWQMHVLAILEVCSLVRYLLVWERFLSAVSEFSNWPMGSMGWETPWPNIIPQARYLHFPIFPISMSQRGCSKPPPLGELTLCRLGFQRSYHETKQQPTDSRVQELVEGTLADSIPGDFTGCYKAGR